jgi:hypothetical protein
VDDLLESWRTLRRHVSHLHVFRWKSSEERWPLSTGADLWPEILASLPSDARWGSPRLAFIEFVRNDDPAQLRLDIATLKGWIEGRHDV